MKVLLFRNVTAAKCPIGGLAADLRVIPNVFIIAVIQQLTQKLLCMPVRYFAPYIDFRHRQTY